mgnify:CR=1 FL=1|tara:strand:+ start:1470 stop:1949 length:480 start_codon:yes stop_codon:yes gene_type:complete
MGIGAYIEDEDTGNQAHIHDTFSRELRTSNGGHALSVTSPQAVFGQFTAANRTTAGTTTVLSPPIDGSLVVTDLIISADKVNAGSITLQFTDGTETVVIYKGITTDAPINISLSVTGRFRGWADARIDLVTVGAVDANVTLGYLKLSQSLTYSVWNSAR